VGVLGVLAGRAAALLTWLAVLAAFATWDDPRL
jgi:hypothetical protein